MTTSSIKLTSRDIVENQKRNEEQILRKQDELKRILDENEAYLQSEEYTKALAEYNEIERIITQNLEILEKVKGDSFDKATERKKLEDQFYSISINEAPETIKETLEELEARLFKKENFTLSKDWEKSLKAEGFKEKEHYYIKNGNFYCKNKKLMEFILGGREAAKKRTIDRYNWAILKSGDTKSSQLPYTCTDEELTKAFKESKARKEWIKDPTVRQKFDNVNNPVGLVDSHGSPNDTDRSYLPLWSPENGEIFYIKSDADEWILHWNSDNDYAFPLGFSAKNS